MKDQSAGGGIESHTAAHARKQSETDAMPVSTGAEANAGKAVHEPETQEAYSPDVSQDSPRDYPVGVQAGSARNTPAPTDDGRSFSRNESAISSLPGARTANDYFPPAEASHPRPAVEPPVTKSTLSELDVNKIIHNPKLRHDINFDPELHFRPNLDGEKGKKKKDKADQFWTSLKKQLVQFAADRESFRNSMKEQRQEKDWCLPSLLNAVKDIISTLVPQRDRQILDEGLQIELLMQQFNNGVADLEKLASWLSRVLKLHCAPMRDEWVDRMYNHLSRGNRNNDIDELVTGLRELLSVLEAMKLDVANHQIRCLRPVLIEDTVHFEQRFFQKKVQTRKLDAEPAWCWFQEGSRDMELSSDMAHYTHAFGEMAGFFYSLTKLMLPSTHLRVVPTTFLFDEERIMKLRSDLYDSICLEICMRKYEDLERLSKVSHMFSSVPSYVADRASNRLSTPSTRGSTPPVGEFNFNAPVTSRPSSLAFSDHDSNNSSRPSSGWLFVQPTTDPNEARAKAHTVYNSLVALLHTATPTASPPHRWQDLAQSMALQILRFVDVSQHDTGSLACFEEQLAKEVSEVQGDMFGQVEEVFYHRLLADLASRVQEFKNMTGVALFSAATGGRINAPGRDRFGRDTAAADGLFSPQDARDDAGIDEIAVRIAHLGILHWRVWAQLVYLNETDTNFTFSPHPTSSGI